MEEIGMNTHLQYVFTKDLEPRNPRSEIMMGLTVVFAIALAVVAFVQLLGGTAAHAQSEAIEKQCLLYGQFTVNETVYECGVKK